MIERNCGEEVIGRPNVELSERGLVMVISADIAPTILFISHLKPSTTASVMTITQMLTATANVAIRVITR